MSVSGSNASKPLRIALASDHAGQRLRGAVRRHLVESGYRVDDLGFDGEGPVDYPDYASEVARRVARGDADRGVLCCGSGLGMMITANRVHGVRAVLPYSVAIARLSRQHNDSNVACFGERTQNKAEVLQILESWLEVSFDGGRHAGRIAKIEEASRPRAEGAC